MKPGDWVRVRDSEYRRAGQVGRVVGFHGVLTNHLLVQFKQLKNAELIEASHLEPILNINAV